MPLGEIEYTARYKVRDQMIVPINIDIQLSCHNEYSATGQIPIVSSHKFPRAKFIFN